MRMGARLAAPNPARAPPSGREGHGGWGSAPALGGPCGRASAPPSRAPARRGSGVAPPPLRLAPLGLGPARQYPEARLAGGRRNPLSDSLWFPLRYDPRRPRGEGARRWGARAWDPFRHEDPREHAREGCAGTGRGPHAQPPQPPAAHGNGPRSPGSRADGKIPGRRRESPQRAV